ncbi:MAG: recombination mediator RecR [Bacteroidota bacterium]|nr:recombination mediator RecR [Bacteroidota bacterium]
MNFSSKLIEEAVEQFSSLPGIGKKTALRLVLHLLKKDLDHVNTFGNTLIKMRGEIKFCNNCHNISDKELCELCANPNRNKEIICVVQDIRDVMAIENTGQHRGVYHVLGGLISPMDGIGPSDLNIESLVQKASLGAIKEIVLALSTTMEGDTTNFYIYKRLKEFGINISIIARGVAFGDEIEYADEVTLGRSIVNRIPYETISH